MCTLVFFPPYSLSGELTWSKVHIQQISITSPFEAQPMTKIIQSKQQQIPQKEKSINVTQFLHTLSGTAILFFSTAQQQCRLRREKLQKPTINFFH